MTCNFLSYFVMEQSVAHGIPNLFSILNEMYLYWEA